MILILLCKKLVNLINVIPNNMERCMAFIISNLVFIDSFQFVGSSLSDLAKLLPKERFHHTKNEYNSDALDLLTKKGVHPYDQMDNFDKFKKKELPPKNEFHSKLTDENISDSDYKHAQTV